MFLSKKTLLLSIIIIAVPAFSQSRTYTWLKDYDPSQSILKRIAPPDGYERAEVEPGSYADWLRHLQLKQGKPPVYLHDGNLKGNQAAHFAVIDIDVGKRDLQQCADAVMRLRAEYLYSMGDFNSIRFNFTSGFNFEYAKWRAGYSPKSYRKGAGWKKARRIRHSYSDFMKYMTLVFSYAGTASLSKELKPVDVADMHIGDVFIKGGFPGHAILVLDMAIKKESGKKLFLLAQSYMPAQDIHVLKNPSDSKLNPWYPIEFGETLYTPEWTFKKSDLKRF